MIETDMRKYYLSQVCVYVVVEIFVKKQQISDDLMITNAQS